MIGKNILDYNIIEKLGEGRMGVVYKAEDPKFNRILQTAKNKSEKFKEELIDNSLL